VWGKCRVGGGGGAETQTRLSVPLEFTSSRENPV